MYTKEEVKSPIPGSNLPAYGRIFRDGDKLIGELIGTGRRVVIAYLRMVV